MNKNGIKKNSLFFSVLFCFLSFLNESQAENNSFFKNNLNIPLMIFHSCKIDSKIFIFTKAENISNSLWVKNSDEEFKLLKTFGTDEDGDIIESYTKCYTIEDKIYFNVSLVKNNAIKNKRLLWESDGTIEGTKRTDKNSKLTKLQISILQKMLDNNYLKYESEREVDFTDKNFIAVYYPEDVTPIAENIAVIGKYKINLIEIKDSFYSNLFSRNKKNKSTKLSGNMYINVAPVKFKEKLLFYLIGSDDRGYFLSSNGTKKGTKKERLIRADLDCPAGSFSDADELHSYSGKILLKLACQDGFGGYDSKLIEIDTEDQNKNTLIFSSSKNNGTSISDILYFENNKVFFVLEHVNKEQVDHSLYLATKSVTADSDSSYTATELKRFNFPEKIFYKFVLKTDSNFYFYSIFEGNMLMTDGSPENTSIIPNTASLAP